MLLPAQDVNSGQSIGTTASHGVSGVDVTF